MNDKQSSPAEGRRLPRLIRRSFAFAGLLALLGSSARPSSCCFRGSGLMRRSRRFRFIRPSLPHENHPLSVRPVSGRLIARRGRVDLPERLRIRRLAGLKPSDHAPKLTKAPVASGGYAGDFDLDRPMAAPYRTEVTVPGDPGRFQWGTEYWVGLSFRLEEWADDQDMEIAPFQIHPTPADWNDAKPASQISTATAPCCWRARK